MESVDKRQHPEASTLCPLAVAAERYFFKPMAIFFNAFHLRAFQTAGMRWEPPVLDVGCSDGEFGVILARTVGFSGEMTGVELSADAIQQAGDEARALYKTMVCANAADLPFDAGTFKTVVINASLTSIHPGLEKAMKEVHRVLREGGAFYATACTDRYEQHYWLSRILNRLGCRRLARRYMNSMNRRMQQGHLYAPARWVELFEENGFRVVQMFGFFPLALTPLWSFLAWTPFRLHGAVKLIPCARLHRGLAALYEKLFRGLYERTPLKLDPERSGYIFIKAVKK